MKTLKQFSIILIILLIGQILQIKYNLSVPSTVLGMIILLLLLITKIIKVEKVERISKVLLEHLTLFFVPVGVGIMTSFDKIKDTWMPLLIILFISTIVVMVVTGLTVQLLNKYEVNKSKRGAE